MTTIAQHGPLDEHGRLVHADDPAAQLALAVSRLEASLAAEGRSEVALSEHDRIVTAIEARDGDAAYEALRVHISRAFETRLRVDAGELRLKE